ncbi:uncharacterized protein LOC111681317 isoform X2 [Lucilia cuprina]|uniref:uncharacterized protein LOC111681317 isoform X2 n=1 Tax=Lucilia cuprina TaxID=7375 RepID=UPI001F068AFC|nr:uncharacterized protein LOC111681317 isoform X2 [Lucilia cuprina]
MPSKKSKIKKENVTTQKLCKFLTWEEVEALKHKYANHIENLKLCINYVKESSALVEQINVQQLISKKWQDYVTCCPLPKAYVPPDIRSCMEKLKYFENVSQEKTIDGLLSVDERCILTQNLLHINLTHSVLKEKNQMNFAREYNSNIEICLQILKNIDNFLDNQTEVAKCGMKKLEDIRELKSNLQQEIAEFLNRFTYRILCSEEAYMSSIDPITSEYIYKADNFQMHIWSLKNVPIRFKQLEEPRLVAKLHGVKLTLHIPTFIMQENFTIRALHLNFDVISENVNSLYTDNAVIEDLSDCIATEWLMQLEIQNRVRNDLLEKRRHYEEKLRLFEEQEEKKNKTKNKDPAKKEGSKSKKTKLIKPSYEPQSIEEDMFPDIREEFLLEEQNHYEDFINSLYNPKSLGLNTNEINLRKYFILGGIYQLYRVYKPKHNDFNSFNMTWHYNDSKLKIDENVYISLNSKPYQRSSKVFKSSAGRNLSLKIEEFNDSDPQCPWFILSIQLPEQLCYWGEPIVCQYETITRTKLSAYIPKVKNNSSIIQRPTNQTLDLDGSAIDKYLPFFTPQKEGLTNSILKLRQLSQESFFRTSLSNVRLTGIDSCSQNYARDENGILNIEDFPINTLLSKAQIRHIQRHVIPRIISSFKFPKEIQEDELKAIQQKFKSKSGLLKRKHTDSNTETSKENNHTFIYGKMQNNPERIIAHYPPVEPIRILQHDINAEKEIADMLKKPISFAHLVKLINFIKWQYKIRVRKIIDLKPFKSKFSIVNKRHKDMRNRKLKNIVSVTSLHSAHATNLQKKTIISKHNLVQPSKTNITKSTLYDLSSEMDITECEQQIINNEKDLETYTHWTTEHILKSEYNKEKRTVVIQTNRLGNFGFAFKRYEHFPFKFWKLEPNPNDPENEIIFSLDTQYVRCILNISDKGIKGHVTEPTIKYIRNPKTYLDIEEPIADFKQLKKMFQEKHLNIFANKDASFYIENGYFSEKHVSAELHCYNCMVVNSSQIKFSHSTWNRLARRRDIILKFLQYQDTDDNTVEVRITPEEAYFVQVSELCSDNADVIELNYNLTWRNINDNSDLHHLINSMYPAANELRCKNVKLINFLRNLLNNIRPLSFS